MIEKLTRWFPWVLLAPAIIPLIYIDGLLYPFVVPKTLLFRGVFIVAAAIFAYLAFSGRQFYFARLRHWVTWIPGALLLVAYGTSLIGLDFYHSFWSIFDRGDGLLTLTCAIGFFYLILLYADRAFLHRLFSVAAWTGSLVALYAVFQWLQAVSGMDFPIIEEARGRLGATLGNAAFLAAYLGMTFFATLAVVKEYRGGWQKTLYVGAALQMFGIVFAATRGTLVALIVVGFLAALYLAWKGDGRAQKYARYGLVAGVVCAIFFFVFRGPLTQAPFEPIRRIASISVQDTTVSSRLFVWQNVFGEAVKEPLTGYGSEHVDVLFNRVYDPSTIVEEWFDRSHNAYLDYFVQYGIVGFLLYAALVLSLILVAWRLWRGSDDRYGMFILLIALVYAIQNFFVFDTAMTLWFLLAIFGGAIARLPRQAGQHAVASPLRITLPHPVSLGIGIVILVLLYPVALQPLRANIALARGYKYHVIDVNLAVEKMTNGLSLNTYADLEYGYQAYVMYTDQQQNLLQGQDRVTAYQYALEILKKNYERYPYDARTATYLAHVLDSAPPEETVDEAYERSVLARVIELSVKRAQPYYILANISLKKGDEATNTAQKTQHYRAAVAELEKYIAMVPNHAEPRFILANLYLVIGDRAMAKKWADEGTSLYKGNVDTARRAVKFYIAMEDWPNALRFLKDVIIPENVRPSSPQGDYEELYDLAKLYFLTGDRESAMVIIQKLRAEKPGLIETDPAFMKAIGGQ